MKKHSNRTIYPTSTTAYGRLLRLAVVTATAVYCPLVMAIAPPEEITGNATHGKVTITAANAKAGLDVYGYYHEDNTTATGGKVIVEDTGTKTLDMVVGGYSDKGDTNNNHVTVKKGKIKFAVEGGVADPYEDTTSQNNTVTINGGEIGGASGGSGRNAINNHVKINGGTITGGVLGGHGVDQKATKNTVSITAGSIKGDVYGGSVGNGTATDNHVTVTAGTVSGSIYGGYSEWGEGTVSDNHVTMSGGEVLGAAGGYSDEGIVQKNTTTISGNAVAFAALGGATKSGTVQGNQLTINGGEILGVTGGVSEDTGTIKNNTVTIKQGTIHNGVVGGASEKGTVSDNTVNIEGGEYNQTMTLYGCETTSGTCRNNTFNIKVPTLKILYGKGIENIEKVDNLYFYLPKDIKKTTPIITVTGKTTDLTKKTTDLTKTRIGVRALSGLTLKVGDEIILIKAAKLKTATTLTNQTAQMKDGLTTYQFGLRNEGNQLIAKVTKITTPPSYTIGGNIKGLSGTAKVTLVNNGTNPLTQGNGKFTFTTKITQGKKYSVTVKTQPSGFYCRVNKGAGNVTGKVTNIAVNCYKKGRIFADSFEK